MTYFLVITAIAHLFMFVNTMTGEICTVHFDPCSMRVGKAKLSNTLGGEGEACFVLEFLRFTLTLLGKAFGFWNEMNLERLLQRNCTVNE